MYTGPKPEPFGVYIKLFHGRKSPEEELDDWGEAGPVFGPFPFVHTTYGDHLKFDDSSMGELRVVDDCLYYDGMYYGDWSVFSPQIFRTSEELQKMWQEFDPAKAIPAPRRVVPES